MNAANDYMKILLSLGPDEVLLRRMDEMAYDPAHADGISIEVHTEIIKRLADYELARQAERDKKWYRRLWKWLNR